MENVLSMDRNFTDERTNNKKHRLRILVYGFVVSVLKCEEISSFCLVMIEHDVYQSNL